MKTEIDQTRLQELIGDLENPDSARHAAAEHIIEVAKAQGWDSSPFYGGRTKEELQLFPLCLRLGIATRIVEIERGEEPRLDDEGFDEELGVAVTYWNQAGAIDIDSLRPEAIFWEQIMPRAIAIGYEATTAG